MKKVIIVGAGLAGLSAAATLAEKGIKSVLISLQPSERAQSVLAEGGINAALDTMGECDSVALHCAETYSAGCFIENEDTLLRFAARAPEIVTELEKLGVPFNRENGKIVLRNFGGQKKKRTAFARSSTGKAVMSSLIDLVGKYETEGFVLRYPHHRLLKVLIEDNVAQGVVVRNVFTGDTLRFDGVVVLAVGGLAGIFYGKTTGSIRNDGTATANLFASGVKTSDLEFIQYHPTTVEIASKRLLISEAARGEGGRLFTVRNGEKYYFMEDKFPELKNLMPRDVVSRECYFCEHSNDTDGNVYLDMTGINDDTWKNKLSDLRKEIIDYLAVDPKTEPVRVTPGIHYFMGGIAVDDEHRTSAKNLYAAGECASIYHGANRLGGNSLLGAVYGGKVCAETLISDFGDKLAAESDFANPELLSKDDIGYESRFAVSIDHVKKLSDILYSALGVVRDEKTLNFGLETLEELYADSQTQAEKERVLFGKAMVLSALARLESRGAHYRSDFPSPDDRFKKKSYATYENGRIVVEFEKA